MKSSTLRKLRLSVYELLLAVEATAELAHSGSANVFPAAWPDIGRLAAKRLERARRLSTEADACAPTGDERKALEAMRRAIDELGKAYEALESGPRGKVLGRVLARAVLRVKGQSLTWTPGA